VEGAIGGEEGKWLCSFDFLLRSATAEAEGWWEDSGGERRDRAS